MNCGEDPARGLWTEEYLIAFSSKSQKMGGGESLQTLHFLIIWVLPSEWFEGGVSGKDIVVAVSRKGTLALIRTLQGF